MRLISRTRAGRRSPAIVTQDEINGQDEESLLDTKEQDENQKEKWGHALDCKKANKDEVYNRLLTQGGLLFVGMIF